MTTERLPQERPPIVAAIVTRNGRVLLVKRRIAEGELSWQFPAGELESAESPDEGAVRETYEEVGLRVTAERVIGERTHPATGRRMVYVGCRATDDQEAGVVDTDELSDVAWTSAAGLGEYVPSGVFPPVLAYLQSRI